MLKLVESQLNQEKEAIQGQQHSQNLLLSNLQTIQVTVIFLYSGTFMHKNKTQNVNFSVF